MIDLQVSLNHSGVVILIENLQPTKGSCNQSSFKNTSKVRFQQSTGAIQRYCLAMFFLSMLGFTKLTLHAAHVLSRAKSKPRCKGSEDRGVREVVLVLKHTQKHVPHILL